MSDPHAPRRVSATIKFPESARYKSDNPWLVFEGSVESVREQIIEAFNYGEDAKKLTLAELVSNAQQDTTALGNAAAGLGGRAIPQDKEGDRTSSSKRQSEKSPEAAEEEKAKGVESELLQQIEDCTTRAEVKAVWAKNKAEFAASPDLMAAYKARGKALPA